MHVKDTTILLHWKLIYTIYLQYKIKLSLKSTRNMSQS